MKKTKILSLLLSVAMILGMFPGMVSAAETETRVPRIFVMGDSMAADYLSETQVPQMGWGQTLQNFFDEDKLLVVNRARGGASSRNFYYDAFGTCWSTVWGTTDNEYLTNPDLLQKGDYVIFTFGANDVKKDNEVSDEDQATTTEAWLQRNAVASLPSDSEYVEVDGVKTYSFKWYMKNYVELIRSRGAIPIMITPPERRVNPSSKKHAVDTTITQYETAVIELAEELNTDDDPDNNVVCPDTDEDNISNNTLALYSSLGDTSTGSKKLFVHLAENQYPLYESGTEQGDNTHFRDFGAVEISRIIIQQLMKHESEELATLKSALKTVSTPFVYDSDHNTKGTAIKQTSEKVKGTTIYPRAQFINRGGATTIVPIMAGYDEFGKLTNISVQDEIDVAADSIVSFDTPYTMPDYQHAGKMKMFVWEKDTLIPLGTDINEVNFTSIQNSGMLYFEADFENKSLSKWTDKSSDNVSPPEIGTLSDSSCLLLNQSGSVRSDMFKDIVIGDAAEENMETVFECTAKMAPTSSIAISSSGTHAFQLQRKNGVLLFASGGYYDDEGVLHHYYKNNDGVTQSSSNITLPKNPGYDEFKLKVVIDEKALTADVYVNDDLCIADKVILALRYDLAKMTNLNISSTGTEDEPETYIDNILLYRQEKDLKQFWYKENFDDWTEVDSSVWRVTNNTGATLASVSKLNGSLCMFVEPGLSTMSDAGRGANEFYKTYLGAEAEDNMETVFEADVKMGVGATISLNAGIKGMFTLYRDENLGTLCHRMTKTIVSDDATTYESYDNDLGFDAPDSTFHFKAVINEKEQTADIYINGVQYAFGESILGVYQYSEDSSKTYYAKFSLAGGTEGTYIDNLTLYRQPITSAK